MPHASPSCSNSLLAIANNNDIITFDDIKIVYTKGDVA